MQKINKDFEFARRIANLEKQIEQPNFCYYISEKQGESESVSHEFNFEFEVKAKTYLKIKINYEISTITQCQLVISVNGAPAYSRAVTQTNGEIQTVLPFARGINGVKVEFISEQNFKVKNCAFETFGNLSYLEKECVLQVINEPNRSVILFLADEKLTVRSYKNGSFEPLYFGNGIKSASLCKNGQNYLLCTVDSGGVGNLILFTENFAVDYTKKLDDELICVCSFTKADGKASVFSVRGTKVYRYDIEEILFFVRRPTGFTGKKIKSNPTVAGYLIIIDYDGSAKLVKV